MKQLYSYDGPVKAFGVTICDRWESSTYAVSEKKARSNLAYQYKKLTGRTADVQITLPGKIEIVE